VKGQGPLAPPPRPFYQPPRNPPLREAAFKSGPGKYLPRGQEPQDFDELWADPNWKIRFCKWAVTVQAGLYANFLVTIDDYAKKPKEEEANEIIKKYFGGKVQGVNQTEKEMEDLKLMKMGFGTGVGKPPPDLFDEARRAVVRILAGLFDNFMQQVHLKKA
jgi:hypothetical protein